MKTKNLNNHYFAIVKKIVAFNLISPIIVMKYGSDNTDWAKLPQTPVLELLDPSRPGRFKYLL